MSKKDKGKKGKPDKKAKKAGVFSPSPVSGTPVPAEATAPLPLLPIRDEAKTEAEIAAQWAHRARKDYRLEDPGPVETDGPTVQPHQVVRPEFRQALLAVPVFYPAKVGDGLETWFAGLPKPTTVAESALLHQLATKMEAGGLTASAVLDEIEGRPSETEGSVVPEGKPEPMPPAPLDPRNFDTASGWAEAVGKHVVKNLVDSLEPPPDPVLQNGNGQAMIHYLDPVTGAEKVKGYTRVTTYIDSLDDKTVLNKWKMRTLLEGAAIDFEQDEKAGGDGGSIAAVGRAVHRLDDALADIDRREFVEQELLGLRRTELVAEHRKHLEGIAENLMDLGGAHDKAIKGTDLHRLTEIVDNGQPLPEGVSASDRRDVEAYQATMAELGIEVLWTERRVVLDDIQVSGTMDRAYLVKLPGMRRRIRVVGDLKTGSVSYAHGKIATQLLTYARGRGYDWTRPLEREDLRLSKAFGLLVHLPQGEGVCEVYVVDLELAARGLDLARQVREWRRDQKRAYDLRNPLRPEPIPTPVPQVG